jgi:hypothetical protein
MVWRAKATLNGHKQQTEVAFIDNFIQPRQLIFRTESIGTPMLSGWIALILGDLGE